MQRDLPFILHNSVEQTFVVVVCLYPQIPFWDRFSCAAAEWRRITRQTLLIERGRLCWCRPLQSRTFANAPGQNFKPQDVFVGCCSLCSIADGKNVILFMFLCNYLNDNCDNWEWRCYDSSQGQAVEAAKLMLDNVSMTATWASWCLTVTRLFLTKICNRKGKLTLDTCN